MGPLADVKIIEFGGVGPGPFCAMLLSDMGAEVLRVDRTSPSGLGVKKEVRFDTTRRGRRSVAIDMKSEGGREVVRELISQADGLIEGFRPGVMERLGFGPDECLTDNPKLVYGRMTGWGQDGPLANHVGHDINYLAISGALGMIGRQGQAPSIPLNLVADLGGGGMYLALGMLAALFEAKSSGKGQVVDAAILDGVASLLTTFYGYTSGGLWNEERERNLIDGGAPWYNVYETSDGKFVSVGAVEAKFYQQLLKAMGLENTDLPEQFDREKWPEMKKIFADVFSQKTRDEWDAAMAGYDACYAPVLTLKEASQHPQYTERQAFTEIDGATHPAPAPRFSRTVSEIQGPPHADGADTDAALTDWGFSGGKLAELRKSGAIA
ncbi:CaiB/BaiF CoA-transferase family protein [Sneathiella sp.]|uniref:CaiB/BaiF CoA transferase family protein n=1 Tax=Sneathiella sp. TaxID=1964365 RepID=UPI00263800B3|nr:CaiB/BaiF CoA-transferase family protein [Sneathiella sp.]MDF2367115.1 CaiB/BaiF CoA-transferase family protein [Sneathiella sp.]